MQPGCLIKHKQTNRIGLIIDRNKFGSLLIKFSGEKTDAFLIDMMIICVGFHTARYYSEMSIFHIKNYEDRRGNRPDQGIVWAECKEFELL